MPEKALIACDEAHIERKRPDESPLISRFQGYLEAWGYQVAFAADGAQAWEKLSSEPFRLILVEFGMPGMWHLRWKIHEHRRQGRVGPAVIVLYPPGDFVIPVLRGFPAGASFAEDVGLMRLCHPIEFQVCVRSVLEGTK